MTRSRQIQLQNIKLEEIYPFFNSLKREKELLMMEAEHVMKSDFVTAVRVDGNPAGLAGIRTTYCFIPDLFIVIKEEYQGRHLSRELMAQELDYARQHLNYLTLSTHETAEYAAARRLYEKTGFKFLRRQGTHFWMYMSFNRKGEVICKLLPLIHPILPFLDALFTGKLFDSIYRRILHYRRGDK